MRADANEAHTHTHTHTHTRSLYFHMKVRVCVCEEEEEEEEEGAECSSLLSQVAFSFSERVHFSAWKRTYSRVGMKTSIMQQNLCRIIKNTQMILKQINRSSGGG